MRVWNLETRRREAERVVPEVRRVAVARNRIAACTGHEVVVQDLDQPEPRWTRPAEGVRAMALSEDAQLLATVDEAGQLAVTDVESGREVATGWVEDADSVAVNGDNALASNDAGVTYLVSLRDPGCSCRIEAGRRMTLDAGGGVVECPAPVVQAKENALEVWAAWMQPGR